MTSAFSGSSSEPVISEQGADGGQRSGSPTASGRLLRTLSSSSIWLAARPPMRTSAAGRGVEGPNLVDELPSLGGRAPDAAEHVHPDHVLRRPAVGHRDGSTPSSASASRRYLRTQGAGGASGRRVGDPLGDDRILGIGRELGLELAIDGARRLLVGKQAGVVGDEPDPERGQGESDQRPPPRRSRSCPDGASPSARSDTSGPWVSGSGRRLGRALQPARRKSVDALAQQGEQGGEDKKGRRRRTAG